MPEPSTPADDKTLESTDSTLSVQSGGIDIAAQQVSVGGDVVGRDKIVGSTAEQVQALLTQISATFQPRPFDGRCPYLGLDAFGEEDADRFFGREKLVADLIARVGDSRFVMIAGPSGSGKSSLVRAGLLHPLKHGALPGSERWLYTALKPGRDPIEQLTLAMARMAKSPDAGHYIRRKGASNADALHESAESLLSDRRDQRAVIVVDQFEETFTQVSNENERAAFLNLLTRAATVENGRVTVLLTMRSDFVAGCASYPALNSLLNRQFMQIGAMQPDELVSAIAQPALRVGLRIDPDLIAQIVEDMRDEPGALPLMQFALKDLFDAQQARGGVIALTLDDYLARGGLHKSLERHADAAFARLSEDEQGIARDVFPGLITIGRGTKDTRRTATFDELVPAGVSATSVDAVVQKLADARLITTSTLQTSEVLETSEVYPEVSSARTVTIAHETLIDAWPWLRRLVNENRDTIELQNRIAEDAGEWESNERDASYLYAGARLATAREQLARKKIVLASTAQAFIEAGLRQAQRRRVTLVGGVAGIIVALLIAVGVFGFQSNENAQLAEENAQVASQAQTAEARAIADANARATAEAIAEEERDEAQRQERIAFSRQIAAQSVAHLNDQFDLALLLSLESGRWADTLEARSSLLTALEYRPQLSTFLYAHDDSINSVAFSPDGLTLALGSGDNTVTLWDVATRQRLGDALNAHSRPVAIVAFSPDGKTLASGSLDHSAILWDVATRRKLGGALRGHKDVVESMAFSPDSAILATGSRDKSIILWNVATGEKGSTLLGDHASWVIALAYSPDGKTLASADGLGKIILWNLVTRQPAGSLESGQGGAVVKLAFSPDGKTLISVRYDGRIFLWDVTSRQALGDPLVAASGSELVLDAAFSPDGRVLAVPDRNNILLWDLTTRQQIGEPLMGHNRVVASLAFSRDGVTLASGSASGTVILWNVNRQHRLAESWATGDVVTSLDFSPDGKVLASSSYNSKSITLWNTRTWEPLGQPLVGHSDVIDSVRFSPDGRTLASAGKDKRVVLWDLSSQRPVGEPLIGHQAEVFSVAFSPDGRLLASGSDDGMVVLWDAATRQRIGQPLTDHKDWVYSVSFSPDGRILASGGGDGTIILWDVSDPQLPVRLTSSLPHGAPVFSIAFSPDGSTLASGGMDKSITLWDAKTWQQIGEPFTGHVEAVVSLDFSNDGTTLVSGSLDNTIILWDTATGNRLGPPLSSHQDWIYGIAFSPDGKMLASGGKDESIVLWDVDVESWQIQACMIVRRNFTRAEWAQYFPGEEYHKTCEQWPEGE